jgi:hypothetical protein
MSKPASHLKCAIWGASTFVAFAAAPALAAPAGDPTEVKGKVAQFSLNPRGAVDGLILADGTEICSPPRASSQLVFAVRPGDAVTIQGLKTIANPVVTAITVTNDATGLVVDARPPGPPMQLEDDSRVKLQLHDPDGHLNGVLLEDGTVVRMPPSDAADDAAGLAVGQPLYVRGDGIKNALGKVIAAREIGPAQAKLVKVDVSSFERWKNELFGGGDTLTPAASQTPAATPAPPRT